MPVFTAIATAISGALFAGSALATSLIAGALTFGANLALSYLNRQKKQRYTAVQGEIQFGADVPAGTAFGIAPVMGQRVYYAKWGSGNKVNADVFALANGWCDGLEPYCYFYGKKYNLVTRALIGTEAAHYGIEGFGSLISIRFYDGRPGQGPDMRLVNQTAALGKTWKATSVGAGICYVIVERTYDADRFANGRPDIKWVLRGLREYDPRNDSTVGGGSGTQRIDDPATWAHTRNPAVHRLNYQLGLKGLLSSRTMIGEGKTLGQIDLTTYFVAMNVSDALRSGKKTYECSLWVDGEMDHTEILKEFDDAMAGYGLNRRGLSGVIPGAPQVPVLTLTSLDLPVDRPQDLQRRKSAFDRYNYISGQFTSIESMWEAESLTPVTVNADVAADGRPRQTSNDFLQVTDPDIAQYLLNIRYRQNRKGGSATVPVSRRAGLAVQEGEWIVHEGIEWLVTEWQCDDKFQITLKLSETGADIYDDGDIEPGPIIIPPTAPINPSLLSTVQNFTIDAGLIAGEAGYDQPALKFRWDPPDDPTITAVRIQYQVNDGEEIFQEVSLDPESGELTTTKNVLSDEYYAARATITTIPDRLKSYTPWVFASTKTPVLDLNVTLGQVGEDVKSIFRDLYAAMERSESLIAQIQQNYQIASSVAQSIGRKLELQGASFSEEIVVLTSDIANVVEQTTELIAQFGGNFANGLVKFEASATPEGALAQIALLVRAGADDAFLNSGLYIRVVNVGGALSSEIALDAQRIVFVDSSDPTNTTPAIVFEDGEAKIAVGNIGDVYAANINLGEGKVLINENGITVKSG